ncbi:MAG: tRNA (adenosine(37)-N6)-threonylcarbamoyltransferase complex ATPase subunit type 1 TsaE [Bdellovibrionales bacterium]|nr:tRNA (adenosine(37)-N6)-threonylcarbamoyltransferase complex ATPase subunit type 1 TsaE [Bdellovibrionales bacterium]
MMKPRRIHNLGEYQKWVVSELVPSLGKREVLLLTGPVGVGKTQLVRFLVEALGARQACSPSFAIHNSYQVARGTVDHVDLYRLENDDDLESTGFWELFAQPEGLILIEWADRLDPEYLPPGWRIRRVEISQPATAGAAAQERQIEVTELRGY